jgi:undecaprenyl-diphosphatase
LLEVLINIDRSLFLELNGLHDPMLDGLMQLLSHRLTAIPLYLFLVYTLYNRIGTRALWMLTLAILGVVVADALASQVMKPLFMRDRPCHDPELRQFVHIVDGYCGGQYGFVSSHAANSFFLAFFLWPFFNRQVRVILFVWAAIHSYSRIYLGVHYPADLVGGAMVGGLVALAMNQVYWMLIRRRVLKSSYYEVVSLI